MLPNRKAHKHQIKADDSWIRENTIISMKQDTDNNQKQQKVSYWDGVPRGTTLSRFLSPFPIYLRIKQLIL